MDSKGIHFYESLPMVMSIEIDLGYPIYLDRYAREAINPCPALAIIGREHRRWYMYSNQFPDTGKITGNGRSSTVRGDVDVASSGGKSGDGMIEFYPPDKLDEFLNQVSILKGVIIQHQALISENRITIFLEYSRKAAKYLRELTLNHADFGGVSSKIEVVETRNHPKGTPFFIDYLKKNYPRFSELELLRTRWKMGRKEIKGDIAGIFMNEGAFRPKYFDDESANLVANLGSGPVHGNSIFSVLDFSMKGKTIEFSVHSRWFGDFFRNVIMTYMGSFYYWAYSDGKGNLENYFILNGNMKGEFLSGLNNHWKEPRRMKHHNSIDYLVKLNEVI